MPKDKLIKLLKLCAAVIAGNALYAITITFFIVPSGLILGGFTGLSIALTHFFEIPASYAVAVFHAIAFLTGSVILGKQFAVSTAAGTILYPLFFHISEQISVHFYLPIIHNSFINAVISIILIGIALGILTKNHTSTGGTEVIPLIINQLTGRSVGALLFLIDGSIMLFQLTYSDFDKILYGILIVTGYSYIVHLMNHRSMLRK